MKYTIRKFHKDFPDDDACLAYLFQQRYGKNCLCPNCQKTGFYRVKGRKCYACAWCGHQIHPLAGTIFHKSSTRLTDWFFAIFLMSQSKNGVAAKEIERHLGVTYKTAWRMQKQIRSLMKQGENILKGTVEVDETYVGGKRPGKRGRGAEGKTPVMGMVQRKGRIKAVAVPDTKACTMLPIIEDSIEVGTIVYTDENWAYNRLGERGFDHSHITHSAKVYVSDDVHTNTIEGFWSQLKRSIHGTYHSVSPKHLQSYVDEFAFRYSNRSSEIPLFWHLLSRLVSPPSSIA